MLHSAQITNFVKNIFFLIFVFIVLKQFLATGMPRYLRVPWKNKFIKFRPKVAIIVGFFWRGAAEKKKPKMVDRHHSKISHFNDLLITLLTILVRPNVFLKEQFKRFFSFFLYLAYKLNLRTDLFRCLIYTNFMWKVYCINMNIW